MPGIAFDQAGELRLTHHRDTEGRKKFLCVSQKPCTQYPIPYPIGLNPDMRRNQNKVVASLC
jgi:hypothetical protein